MSVMSVIHKMWTPTSAQHHRSMVPDAPRDEAASLRRELAALTAERERERAQMQERIDDLTRRLDAEAMERRNLVGLLADQRSAPVSAPLRTSAILSPSPGEPLAASNQRQKQFFEENGYLILEGFFSEAQIARLKARFDGLWAERGPDCPLVIDRLETGERAYFRDVDESVREAPYKLNDLHFIDEVVRDIALEPRLLAILTDLLSATPVVCNTLLLERGTGQNAHFDTFFMPSATPNKMCAAWVAIDPVTDANGPLFYYPKSHLIEPYRFSNGKIAALVGEMPDAEAYIARIIEEHGLEEARFYPKPGDLLIWHAQLLHGGSPIVDSRATRKSLVTHYWTTIDCPNAADRIVVGDGGYLLRKPYLTVVGASDAALIDSFVRGLDTPPEYLVDVPPGFDPRTYLMRNIEVFRAGIDPYTHYHLHGRHEGRVW
jgi:phytanoyl-CoA hydroxylase